MKINCEITKADIPTLDYLIDAGAFDRSGHIAVEALLGDLAVDAGDPLHPAQGTDISLHATEDGHEIGKKDFDAYIAALGHLQSSQQMLLGLDLGTKLMDDVGFKKWCTQWRMDVARRMMQYVSCNVCNLPTQKKRLRSCEQQTGFMIGLPSNTLKDKKPP
ncbi:hypothetical protein BSKO_05663 [Bryopsis sp. KO-2023]|nr:hypothetical protein BSKO_05661 [Bryopsis sp. KO-2023]GMH37790.1 hypothetical protein BSKO_05663 [Bryopsis sp. KO-2023]